jgi:hypothetical protein
MSQVSRPSLRTTRTTLPMALQASVLTLRMENLLAYLQELLFRKAQFGHILCNRIGSIDRQDEPPHTDNRQQPPHDTRSFSPSQIIT